LKKKLKSNYNSILIASKQQVKMNTEEINELTEWAFKMYIKVVNENDEKKNIIALNLPIDSIDGVKLADKDLRIQPTYIDFMVRANNYEYAISHYEPSSFELVSYAWVNGKRPDIRFTKREIRYAITKLFVIMHTIRYNVFTGQFEEKPKEKLPLKAMFKLSAIGACKPSMTTQECCVCYEATQTHFSKCGHTICGKCISQLPEKCCRISCPMCRAKIQTSEEEQEEYEQQMAEETDEE
jgi:hypothetical protein